MIIFPNYNFTQTEENGKLRIVLETHVRSFEVNSQKWYLTSVVDTSLCNHDEGVEQLNHSMHRFLQTCYIHITVGFFNTDQEPVLEDKSQISEKERMKNIIKN